MIEIDLKPREKGTVVLTVGFLDEDGVAVVPSSITWHLTDVNGLEVNGLVDKDFSPPAEVIEIVLTADDLALGGGPLGYTRVFSVTAPYASTLGSLVINEEARFDIENLVKVT